MRRIHLHHRAHGREIKQPGLTAQSGRRIGPRAFRGHHAVGFVQHQRMDGGGPACADVLQFTLGHAGDSTVAAQPEVFLIIFEDLGDEIIAQALPVVHRM